MHERNRALNTQWAWEMPNMQNGNVYKKHYICSAFLFKGCWIHKNSWYVVQKAKPAEMSATLGEWYPNFYLFWACPSDKHKSNYLKIMSFLFAVSHLSLSIQCLPVHNSFLFFSFQFSVHISFGFSIHLCSKIFCVCFFLFIFCLLFPLVTT